LNAEEKPYDNSLRDMLRKATGFSLTACRASTRAATGISLSALYGSSMAATSDVVRKTMKWMLSPFPTWFRYFLQPFLVFYYTPLFIVRNLTGPTRHRALESHEAVIQGWKAAVVAAEKSSNGYWPVRVTEDGEIVTSPSESGESVDIADGVAESVNAMMEQDLVSNETKGIN